MAKVQGVKEKLHFPLYDAFFVPEQGTFQSTMTDPRVIRFFVDIQNKTKLETNLQASGVLPSLNTFEARALRVVASTFCVSGTAFDTPTFRRAVVQAGEIYRDLSAPTDADKNTFVNSIGSAAQAVTGTTFISSQVREDIINAADNYRTEVRTHADYNTAAGTKKEPSLSSTNPLAGYHVATHEHQDRFVAAIISAFERKCASVNTVLAELIYNSVTTLLVGEKIMIEAPTFWFPSGAGVFPGFPTVSNHGEPDPTATFRFAEPVFIEPQQNFRVEMLFPRGVPGATGTSGTLATVLGPLRIWVALDGYLTRDVQ